MSAFIYVLAPLIITLIFEVPLGVIILKRRQAVIPLCLVNLLTNPMLNAALLSVMAFTQSYTVYYIAAAAGELAVFIGEAFLLRLMLDLPLKRSLIISTVLNSVSLFLGSAVLALF